MYSEIVKEHAVRPRNRGELSHPDFIGEANFPRCGDKVKLFLKLRDQVIEEATFTASACGPAIAAASLATTLMAGLTLEQAREVLTRELPRALHDLPASKRHAVLLVFECLVQILEQKATPNT